MISDAELQFSSAQAITADAISENVIDLGPLTGGEGTNLIRDIGAGQPVGILFQVETALTDADGTPTLTITLESDDVEALNTAPTVHQTIGSAITEAAMVAGYTIYAPLAPGAFQRYLGLRYTTNGADFDGGTVNAWIVVGDPTNWRAYASGFVNNVA